MATSKGTDRQINPLTKDYILEADTGAYTLTRNADTAVYHQVSGKLGEWFADSEAGSELHKLLRMRSSQRTMVVVLDMITAALQPLIDDGRVSVPIFDEQERSATFRITTSIQVQDLQSGRSLDITSLLPLEI